MQMLKKTVSKPNRIINRSYIYDYLRLSYNLIGQPPSLCRP